MLLQPGETLRTITSDLLTAIQHASMILSWYENLPEREMPPEWTWPFPDELEEHFVEIKFEREQRMSGNGGGNDGDQWAPNMMSNDWSPDD